jgi:hypothetical protein
MYRRNKTRPPRQIEQSEAMLEGDELRGTVDRLEMRNQELKSTLQIRELEVEKLLDDKIALVRELREARTTINFLKGRYT